MRQGKKITKTQIPDSGSRALSASTEHFQKVKVKGEREPAREKKIHNRKK